MSNHRQVAEKKHRVLQTLMNRLLSCKFDILSWGFLIARIRGQLSANHDRAREKQT